jgi:two-component system chemotaxis response regulator CheY
VSGHKVKTASDGKEGMQKFNDGDFDAVITEFNLPGINAKEMIEHIRNSDNALILVIAMPGRPQPQQNTGYDLVLSKPFPIPDLVASIPILERQSHRSV